MLLPVKWLKDYIDTDKTSKDLADGLTLSGSHVESIYSLNNGIEKVIVGKITSIEKHPNADKLVICQIDIGEEVLQIVTGAKNINEGDFVPVATIGAKLPGDVEIQKTNFRGIDSYGMLCSLKELGYSDSVIPKEKKDGIFILDKEYPLGSDIVDVLGLNDEIIELEITPNRPDCLSIIGMARETSATFDIPMKEPTVTVFNGEDDIYDYLDNINVESKNCTRYYARIIKDVRIKESPFWLQTRLMEAGVRPINNIVDITNYVMLEYGEPLHAFDLDKIEGKKIIVRQANEGERLITLDNMERKLSPEDLVIADEKSPIAIAGVMGGLDSEVTEDTKVVLLEGANFSQRSVRLTSKKLGLRTEASSRFEKGLDPNLCDIAVNRVCQLVDLIGAGKVVNSAIDIYEDIKAEKVITLRPERVNKLLGIDISTDDMKNYLELLGLESTFEDGLIHTTIPTYRLDLSIEADLIEEIGRLYGFHNIASKPLVGVFTRVERPYEKTIEDKVKSILVGFGLNEIMTYSFISPKAYDKINVEEDSHLRKYISLMNPLGEDYSSMRTTLIPTMMDLLSRNYNRGIESAYTFEIGNIFIPKQLPVVELPDEKKVLSIGFYGKEDFYYLKEIIEKMLSRLGIQGIEYTREENNPTFHPGRTANLIYSGEKLGIIGEISMDVCEKYDIDKRIYIGQLDFDKIVKWSNFNRKYSPLPKYPAMIRDIAVVLDEDILVGEIQKKMEKHGQGLIEKIELFDIYRGNQVPEGMKSVAFSITYRSKERTLTDKEVNDIQELIIKDLEDNLGAKLRS